jgi:predicted DNA-binding transcriptional regulator YafY
MLIEAFGVSKALAYKDIAYYKKCFPDNIAPFDAKLGHLKPASAFSCQLVDPCKPPTELVQQVPKLEKTVSGDVLQLILKAIDQNRSIEVNYASSNNPIGKKRLITPSRIINASNRLHFRGYCHANNNYRDFVVARCQTLPKLKNTPSDLPADYDIQETVEITLKVNSALCVDGRRLVEKEYYDVLSQPIHLPRALFHYFLIDNNLPVTPEQLDLALRVPWAYPLLAETEVEDLLFGTSY